MIPQKFIMMKCVRLLFFLHVVGIVFVGYKIYSNAVSQSRGSNNSARDVVSWSVEGNNTSSSSPGNEDAEENAEDDFDVDTSVIQEEDGGVDSSQNAEETVADEGDVQEEEEVIEAVSRPEETVNKVKEPTKSKNSRSATGSGRGAKVSKSSLTYKKVKPETGPKNSHWTLARAGKYSPSLYSPPSNERPRQRLPQALVIGSPNSGIRPLLDFLEVHPNIVPVKKEIPMFDKKGRLQLFTSWFLAQMPVCFSNQVPVARSHFSHWSKKAVCELYLRHTDLRVIVVLRDPVSRLLSQATSSASAGPGQLVISRHGETLRINNDTQTVEWGRYVEYLKMWVQCFPKTQIHIVEWSDIMQHPGDTVHKIEGFLGVPYRLQESNFYRDEARRIFCIHPLHFKGTVCLSDKKARNPPTLSREAESLIYKFYSKHNEELFKLLGQRYQWGP